MGHCSSEEGKNGYYGQVTASATGAFAYLHRTACVGITLLKKQLAGTGDCDGHVVNCSENANWVIELEHLLNH